MNDMFIISEINKHKFAKLHKVWYLLFSDKCGSNERPNALCASKYCINHYCRSICIYVFLDSMLLQNQGFITKNFIKLI